MWASEGRTSASSRVPVRGPNATSCQDVEKGVREDPSISKVWCEEKINCIQQARNGDRKVTMDSQDELFHLGDPGILLIGRGGHNIQ